MPFGLGFEKGFTKGVPLGVRNYQVDKSIRANQEKEEEKRRQKIIEQDNRTTAMGKLIGIETRRNKETNELELDVPEDFQFKGEEITDAQKLQFLPEVGNEFQEVFRQLEKEATPEDFYINKRRQYDPKTGKGMVVGIDKRTGNVEKIGEDPFYVPKKTGTTVIEGVIDFEGTQIGQKGKRTQLTTYEDGTFDVIEKGNIKGDGTDKPIETVLFEAELSELGTKKEKAIGRRNTYIQKGINKKGFGDVQAREAFRDGINAELNEVAWQYAELASDEGQQYIKEIFDEGKNIINKKINGNGDNPLRGFPIVNRDAFYRQKLEEVTEDYKRGKWGYEDFTAIVQFLDAKYKSFLQSEDPVKDEDELFFDLPELQ
jgi:hypothetical protein